MSIFSSILAALAAQAGPPSISVPDAMAPQSERYLLCVQGETLGESRIVPSDAAVFESRLQTGIENCAELRTKLEVEADEALRDTPKFSDPEARSAAIEQALDGVIEGQRSLYTLVNSADQPTDVGSSKPIQSVQAQAVVAPIRTRSIDIPDELAPAAFPYMQCKLDAAGAPITELNGEPAPKLYPENMTCDEVRTVAIEFANELLKKNKDMSRREKGEFIRQTFDSVDQFVVPTTRSYYLPEDLEAAFNPYLGCLMLAELREQSDPANCGRLKEQALRDAAVQLEGDGRTEEERSQYISEQMSRLEASYEKSLGVSPPDDGSSPE